MVKFCFLSVLFVCAGLFAAQTDIEFQKVNFKASQGGFVPEIEGFKTDAIGEKMMLPYKNLSFSSAVRRVEILQKETVKAPGNIKTGNAIYRFSPYSAEKVVLPKDMLIPPSLDKFYTISLPANKRGVPIYDLKIFPLIPKSDNEFIQIRKIRVYLDAEPKGGLTPFYDKTAAKSILILTTNDIMASSKEIMNYIEAKKQHGFTVGVATEDQYGGSDLKGAKKAVAIRTWLATVYKKYSFLLIIANPIPETPDIPMMRTYINDTESVKDYQLVPSDFFYGELNSDWDYNGNGKYAETADHINFYYELIVGRIPVYDSSTKDLDKILRRTINYMNESPVQAAYRKRLLFPTTISYYENQDGQPMPKMDGGYVVEYLMNKVIPKSFDVKILVEKEGVSPSEFSTNDQITGQSVIDEWNKGVGAVFWMGHGMPTYSVRTIWASDSNNDKTPQSYSEFYSSTFISSSVTGNLPADMPAFVFEGSCLNGEVETTSNIGYSMLLNTSVGVVASSQVTYGGIFPDYDPDNAQDVFAVGAYFIKALVNNEYPAKMLYDLKADWSNDSVLPAIKMELNYLGDPSLKLNIAVCDSDSQCDDGLFCNGEEFCNNGFCDIKNKPVDCPESENGCMINVCDESAKACLLTPKDDGIGCSMDVTDKCFERSVCKRGLCEAVNPVDCSRLDGECTKGVCDSETGTCSAQGVNEGATCSADLFCTVESRCSAGACKGKEKENNEIVKECMNSFCDEAKKAFISIQDLTKNGLSCKTDSGADGICSYGTCAASATPTKTDTKSSGCSLTLL